MNEGAAAERESRRRRLDLGLALLVLFVVALNLPYLDARILPLHDSFYSFVNFQIFYNEFFFERDLAHWYPYCGYGLPADLQQLISLTPMSYVVGLAGALVRATDTLLLFKLSVVGEQLVYVIGTYLLARRLFASRATALALGVAAAGTLVWYAQLWFELRFFYLLPVILYCVVTFLERRRSEWLWLAGIACVAWSMGNVPYFVPLWGFVLLICVAGAAWRYQGEWSRLFARTGPNLLLLFALGFGVVVYVHFAFHALDFLVMHVTGRDPLTTEVDLETFRTYGGNADLFTVARSFLLGWPIHLPWGSGADNSAYIGLLPLAGVGMAFAFERSRLFLGIGAALIALVWLSLGGIFTTLVYYLPTLSQYRHVGLVYGLVKALAIIAAGYGIERLWRRPFPLPSRRVLWSSAVVLAVASAGVVPALWHTHVFLRLWLYLVVGVLSLALTRSPKPGLVIALALDLALYQAAVYRQVPKLPPGYGKKLDTVLVHELAYQPRRYASPADAPRSPDSLRAQRALSLTQHPGAMAIYWITYGFAQFDPCWSQYTTELTTQGVNQLLRVARKRGPALDAILGCDAPKLRLVAGATLVEGAGAARDALRTTRTATGPIADVIRLPPVAARPANSETWTPEAGTVQVTQFTLNEVVAQTQVTVPDGAWLVYADAFHPGWRARVDGREAPIAEANLAFKAVWLPSGDHVVRFWYQPGSSYYASYALAAFGLACGLTLLAGLGVAAFPRSADRATRGVSSGWAREPGADARPCRTARALNRCGEASRAGSRRRFADRLPA